MGCDDRESNFQRETFHDGKWWASAGYTPSWEGPIEELVKKFPGYAEPRFFEGDNVYATEKLNDSTAIVKPLGKIALNSTNS